MILIFLLMVMTTVVFIWDCKDIKNKYRVEYYDEAIKQNLIIYIVFMLLYILILLINYT